MSGLDKESNICYEVKMVCPICLSPRLEMVTSACQHRFCIRCVYTANGKIRSSMTRCPSCQRPESLPASRPVIPEDTIEIQRILGVVECTEPTCEEQYWSWETETHMRNHHQKSLSPEKQNKTPSRRPKPSVPALKLNLLRTELKGLLDNSRSTRKNGLPYALSHSGKRYPLRSMNMK